jgi:hypothetical protein
MGLSVAIATWRSVRLLGRVQDGILRNLASRNLTGWPVSQPSPPLAGVGRDRMTEGLVMDNERDPLRFGLLQVAATEFCGAAGD